MYVSQCVRQSPSIVDRVDVEASALAARTDSLVGRGYVPSFQQPPTAEQLKCLAPFNPAWVIPRSEWRERIEARERNNATLAARGKRAGIRTVSQSQTNFCWSFGGVRSMEYAKILRGDTHVPLSPTACACKITGFRNVGGNTFDIIPHLQKLGAPPVDRWPLNNLSREFDTESTWEAAADHRIFEWLQLGDNNFDQAMSALLLDMPVTLGLLWWGHMVCGVDPVALDGQGQFGILIHNSHGESYGDGGLAVLPEKKATGFDQVAVGQPIRLAA